MAFYEMFRYDRLKEKVQNNYTHNEYLELMYNTFVSNINLQFGDDDINKFPFLIMALNSGEIGIAKDGEKIVYGSLVRGGKIDINGESKIKGIVTLNGKTINTENVVLYRFMPSGTPYTGFSRFADRMTETDKSQRVLVQYTRAKDILIAKDEEQRNAINTVLDKAKDGVLSTIVLDDDLFSNGESQQPKITLNDVTMFQSMEYLSAYHAELCRRIYGLWGFSMQGKNKQAQITSTEADDMEAPSVLAVLMVLEQLQNMCEEVNEKFGRSWSVAPSEIVQRQIMDALRPQEQEEQENEMKGGVDDENERNNE